VAQPKLVRFAVVVVGESFLSNLAAVSILNATTFGLFVFGFPIH
jgi:hypothetical protein